MATKTEIDRLKKYHQYNRYVTLREQYKLSGQYTDVEAGELALEVCLGSLKDLMEDGVKSSEGIKKGVEKVNLKGLVSRDVFKGRDCDIPTSIEWVAKHIALIDTRPEDAPSAESWGLLQWAQSGDNSKQDFWKNIYPKLIPSRQAIDAINALKDDGRTTINMIDNMIKISNKLQETIDD